MRSPWDGSQDVTAHLDRLRAENAWIEGQHCSRWRDFAGACGRIGAGRARPRRGAPISPLHAGAIPDLGELEREIRRCLTPEGEVRDDASEELLRLRRGIGRTRRDVVATLERLMGEGAARRRGPGADRHACARTAT